jgi:RHS repeat-associated protein
MARHFSGNYISSDTVYGVRGEVEKRSKPYDQSLLGPHWMQNYYDWQGRVWKTTEALANIDGPYGDPTASAVKNLSYSGFIIHSWTTVKGEDRHRLEWKNALGKVSRINDANGALIRYAYDVDGNLSDVYDAHAGHDIHIDYDLRGRKKQSTDADLGQWTYGYSGYGDLTTQKDGAGQTTTMTYDVFGRMTTKTYDSGTAEWVYDKSLGAGIGRLAASVSPSDVRQSGECVIPYTTQSGPGRTGRSYKYNEFGDVLRIDECIDGQTFTTGYKYDEIGRQNIVIYPEVKGSSFAVKYRYTKGGFLYAVTDFSDDSLLWTAETEDVLGNPSIEYTRNGVKTWNDRNETNGWLLGSSSLAQADNHTILQEFSNTFDEAGNLRVRKRKDPTRMGDSVETFDYDLIDRLKSSHVVVAAEKYDSDESFKYDTIGNLTEKGGKTYSYVGCAAGGGPHALCSVDSGEAYSYDGNGNMVSGNGRTVAYTYFNKVKEIKGGNALSDGTKPVIQIVYGADGDRVIQSVETSAGTGTAHTLYVGMGGTGKSLYERTKTFGNIEHVHFLYAGNAHGGNAFAMFVKNEDTTTPDSIVKSSMRYNLFDHLGSITATTDESGRVLGADVGADIAVFGYDPWGKRRNPDGRVANGPLNLQVGHREYTGHETIPNVGLVNMNGRVYDPELGRFLSGDPTVQFVANLQSYNRYSYVQNNPLSFTDPTGFGRIPDGPNPILTWSIGIGAMVGAMGVCVGTEGAGCMIAWSMGNAILGASAAVNEGASWQQAGMMAGFSMGISMGVNSMVGFAAPEFPGSGPILGAFSGAATTAIMTEVTGGQLGWNILESAAQGAFAGMMGPSDHAETQVSQKNGREPQSSIMFVPARKVNGFYQDLTDLVLAQDMTFDGQKLRLFEPELTSDASMCRERQLLGEWDAVSGRPGYQGPEYQNLRNMGPIPEGNYLVSQSRLQFADWLDQVEGLLGHGAWKGGSIAWGDSRVWLDPLPGTDTFGRSNFSIHGGWYPGSAGCIDLTSSMPSFTNQFQRLGLDLTLQVQY